MGGTRHTPPLFSEEVYFSQHPLLCPSCVLVFACTAQLAGWGLAQSPTLLRGSDRGKEGATPGRGMEPWNEGKAERSSTRGQERVERATASLFLKNSIIWKKVVINSQNTLQSPTFHTAPLLTALWFFRQNFRALIKP